MAQSTYYLGESATNYVPYDKLIAASHYIMPNFATLEWDRVSRDELKSNMDELEADKGALNDDLMMYIHVPYCKSFCHYCNFNKNHYPRQEEERLDAYVDYCIKEIDFWMRRPYLEGRNFNAIYIGGGSPSTLPTRAVAKLFEHLERVIPNYRSIEKTFTGESRTLKRPDLLALLHAHEWQRITFGIETLDAEIHRQIGRWDTRADVDAVFEGLATLGYRGERCVDLMYDLPGQTLDGFQKELEELLQCYNPDEIDAFGTVYLPYRPLHKLIIQGRVKQPGNGWQLLQMRELLYDFLTDRGYHNNIAETFGKRPEKTLYQTAHCARQDIVGIGCAARGNLQDKVYINPEKVEVWMQNIDERGYSTTTLQPIGLHGVLDRVMVMFPRFREVSKAYLSKFAGAKNYERTCDILDRQLSLGLAEEHADRYTTNKLGVLWHGNMQTDYMTPTVNMKGKMLLNVIAEPKRNLKSTKPRFAVNAATKFIADHIDEYPKLMK